MSTAAARAELRTSGLVRLTRPQLIGTMLGLILAVMLASLDQTSAAIMIGAVVLNLMLRNIPLRRDALQPDAVPEVISQ